MFIHTFSLYMGEVESVNLVWHFFCSLDIGLLTVEVLVSHR